MRRPQGYAVWHTEDGTIETDTIMCLHCGRHQFIKPRQDPSALGGYCTLCAGYVCRQCDDGTCTPFERRLEAAERADRFAPPTYQARVSER